MLEPSLRKVSTTGTELAIMPCHLTPVNEGQVSSPWGRELLDIPESPMTFCSWKVSRCWRSNTNRWLAVNVASLGWVVPLVPEATAEEGMHLVSQTEGSAFSP